MHRYGSGERIYAGQPLSFRRQIALSYLLLVGLCLGLPGNAYMSWYRDSETERFRKGLMQHAEFVAELLRNQPASSVELELTGLALSLGAHIQILDGSGQVQFDSHNPMARKHRGPQRVELSERLHRALEGTPSASVELVRPEKRLPQEPALVSAMVLAVPIKEGLVLSLERSLLDVEMRILEFQATLMQVILTSLALAAIIGYLMSTWLSRPLTDLAQQAHGLSEGTADSVEVGSPAELRDLAQHFNQMGTNLKAKTEVMRSFLADASHELKTPLASLAALSDAAELAASDDDPERVASLTTLMRKETLRLGKLVDALLTIHRLESQAAAPSEELCLLGLAEDCVDQMGYLNPEIETTISGQPLSVPGSRDALKQVLLNLLANAQRAVENVEEPRIQLRVLAGDSSVLEVEDNGVGLTAEQLERVFDRFYRVDEARARTDGGNGLGLAIAHRIVAHHGGELKARSIEGESTVFSIHLPNA